MIQILTIVKSLADWKRDNFNLSKIESMENKQKNDLCQFENGNKICSCQKRFFNQQKNGNNAVASKFKIKNVQNMPWQQTFETTFEILSSHCFETMRLISFDWTHTSSSDWKIHHVNFSFRKIHSSTKFQFSTEFWNQNQNISNLKSHPNSFALTTWFEHFSSNKCLFDQFK